MGEVELLPAAVVAREQRRAARRAERAAAEAPRAPGKLPEDDRVDTQCQTPSIMEWRAFEILCSAHRDVRHPCDCFAFSGYGTIW